MKKKGDAVLSVSNKHTMDTSLDNENHCNTTPSHSESHPQESRSFPGPSGSPPQRTPCIDSFDDEKQSQPQRMADRFGGATGCTAPHPFSRLVPMYQEAHETGTLISGGPSFLGPSCCVNCRSFSRRIYPQSCNQCIRSAHSTCREQRSSLLPTVHPRSSQQNQTSSLDNEHTPTTSSQQRTHTYRQPIPRDATPLSITMENSTYVQSVELSMHASHA